MKAIVTKSFNGKQFSYSLNGEHYKNSKRDFKYACVATFKHSGAQSIISLGNKKESTYNSMARFYSERCKLEVIEIVNE